MRIVMGHFQPGPFEPTLDIEALVCFTAIQNTLVATNVLGNIIECLYNSQSQLFTLLILVHCDVFDVPNPTHIMYEFALHDHGTSANHARVGVADD